MARVGLTPRAVVDHALDLLDAQGPEGLTLAAVAAKAGVATPSLYKHVPGGLPELRRLIAVRVTEDLAAELGESVLGRSRDEAVAALIGAYLSYAERHPYRYNALPQAPEDDADLREAAARLVGVILAVLRGYDLAGEEAIHAARTVRAMAHGFASLTTAGAFQLAANLVVTRDRLTRVLTEGLRAWPPAES